MIRQLLQTDIGELPRFAGDAWRWWRAQLAMAMPAWLAGRLQSDRRLVVDLAGEELTVTREGGKAFQVLLRSTIPADPPAIDRLRSSIANGPSQKVVLRLPAAEIARQVVTLPLAARHRLRQVLAFEMDRLSPIDPRQARFAFRLLAHDSTKRILSVELLIMRKSTIDQAIGICRQLSLRPVELCATGSDVVVEARELFPRYAVLPQARRGDIATAALRIAALLLAAALAIAVHQRNQTSLEALQQEAAHAKLAADHVIKQRQELSQRLSRANFLARLKGKPSVAAILAEATRILPDEIWVAQLELAGSEVRLRGYAPKAASLIALIEKSPLFEKPQFRAPIVRAPNGDGERFDLSFLVKGTGS